MVDISTYTLDELRSLLNSIEKTYEDNKSTLVKLLDEQETVHREMDKLYDRYQLVLKEIEIRGEDVINE